tara:strand:+ start:123 stop:296 length:174 start_codon:yes stop_codon:yes gene_type:complete
MSTKKSSEDESSDPMPLVMVVDDESEISALWAKLLKSFGYRVCSFSDGLSAWNAFQQ